MRCKGSMFSMKLFCFGSLLLLATIAPTTYSASPLTAIKERALAKHKSSGASSPSQVSKASPSSIQRSGIHTTGKKWRTVYSKYKGPESRLQVYQAREMLGPERSANTASPNSPHSSTNGVGFANLGVRKDQTTNKHSSNEAEQVDSPIIPLQVEREVKKEHEVRAGYLMPDEELLQKWTNSL